MCSGTDSAATVKGNTTKEQDDTQRKTNADSWKADWLAHGVKDPTPGATSPGGIRAPSTYSDPNAPNLTANNFVAHMQEYQGFDLKPPPDPPDITDTLVRQRRASVATQLLLSRARGRAGTMEPAGFGDLQAGKNKLYGGGGS
jgi:hypothetical protein